MQSLKWRRKRCLWPQDPDFKVSFYLQEPKGGDMAHIVAHMNCIVLVASYPHATSWAGWDMDDIVVNFIVPRHKHPYNSISIGTHKGLTGNRATIPLFLRTISQVHTRGCGKWLYPSFSPWSPITTLKLSSRGAIDSTATSIRIPCVGVPTLRASHWSRALVIV